MKKRTRFFVSWILTLLLIIGTNVSVMGDMIGQDIQGYTLQEEDIQGDTGLEITTPPAITQNIQLDKKPSKPNTQIHVQISGSNTAQTNRVIIKYQGNDMELTRSGNGSLYKAPDGDNYVSDDITEIRVVLENGEEIIYYEDDWDSSPEGEGTINYWLTLPEPEIIPPISISKIVDKPSAYPGDIVEYTITVTNTGDKEIKNIIVSDPFLDWNSGKFDLNKGVSKVFTGSKYRDLKYRIPDDASGVITNRARATWGKNSVVEAEVDVTVLVRNPAVTITKTADKESAYPGDVVTYTITVTNTGDKEIKNIIVSDPFLDWNSGKFDLNKGVSKVFTGSKYRDLKYRIPDDASGVITNRARATWGKNSVVEAEVDVTVLVRNPAVTITKTADKKSAYPGDIVTYTITVTNTGNINLTGITVSDSMFTDVGWPKTINLAVGESQTFSEVYTIPDEESDTISNTATATWGGISVSKAVDVTVLKPAVSITKVVKLDGEVITSAYQGEEVAYEITVTNTGNVNLEGITLSDPMFAGENRPDDWPSAFDLAKGEARTLIAAYTIPANTLGTITNTATASWTYDEKRGEVSATATLEVLQIDRPAVSITKVIKLDEEIIASAYRGDEVTYEITVTNTGNVNLEYVIVSDPMFEDRVLPALLRTDGWPKIISLEVGGSEIFSEVYTIPNDAPSPITNTATVSWVYNDEEYPPASATATLQVLTRDDGGGTTPPGDGGGTTPPGDGGGTTPPGDGGGTTPPGDGGGTTPPGDGGGTTPPGDGGGTTPPGDGGGTTPGGEEIVEIIDEAIPLGYAELEQESIEPVTIESITDEPITTEEVVELKDELIPAGPAILPEATVKTTLPKTGGIPAGVFYGFGTLLVTIGSIFKFRKKDKAKI